LEENKVAYELIMSEKFNQSYRGKAEWCHWSFKAQMPDQMGTRLIAEQTLNSHIAELEKQGCQILEYRMWEDRSPMWETYYYIEVVATASPIWWTAIILAALAILALIIVYFITKKTGEIVEYVGEKAPATFPLLAIAAIGAFAVAGIFLVKRDKTEEGG
jgi:hypothetical protein